MPVGLVAIDLDGTLIGADLMIHEVDAQAIRRARDADIAICLATGRLFDATRPFVAKLGLSDPVIALNGAAVYVRTMDDSSYGLARSSPLDRSVALRAYDSLKRHDFHLQLYYGDRLYLDELDEGARLYLAISPVEPVMVPDLRALLVDALPAEPGPMKVLAVASPSAVVSEIRVLSRELGADAHVFRSQPPFLEVTSPSADKGAALAWIAQRLGLPMSLTAAVGDSDNDVPMFKAAARSFAVAGATDAARAAATALVAARDRGGVAEAISAVLYEFAAGRR